MLAFVIALNIAFGCEVLLFVAVDTYRCNKVIESGITVSICPSVSVCLGFVQGISSELESSVTKCGMLVHHLETQCQAQKKRGCYFQGQGCMNQNRTVLTISFELMLLFFCNQTYFNGRSAQSRVSCEKIELLCSRSKSQGKVQNIIECWLVLYFWVPQPD